MIRRPISLKALSGASLALAALVLALAWPPASQAYDYSYARVVRLSLVEGDVQVARPDSANWEPAQMNLPIQQGYSLSTGAGRAEVEFESGATARLAENSILQFTELALSGGARITKMTLTRGTATFYANLAREDSFVVATPHVQVAIPENARFRVDVYEDNTSVSVLKGDVAVDSGAGTNRLTKGHTLVYNANDPDRVSLQRNPKADDWDRWVADRDEVAHTATNTALRYVNSPYSYGLADLYGYGSWYNIGGFGQCWQPYGVGFGWSPYWNGRWMFFPGLGWTWVSYEPWGWLPYHFGRWMFLPAYGWLWVPGFRQPWQPALVTWVRVGNAVGWVPLAPQDRQGQTPTNLQQGLVSTSGTVLTSSRLRGRGVKLGEEQDTEVLPGPPASFGAPTVQNSATPANRLSGPATTAPAPTRSTGTIVFDPKERRYINEAWRPHQVEGRTGGDARVQSEDGVRAPGRMTTAPPTASTPRVTPAPTAPPRVVPRAPTERPAPLPRGDRPAPAPRAEPVPRSTPIPRAEPPPRSAPMPRMEPSPRSAPMPRAEPAPRPSPGPGSAPHAKPPLR